MREFLRFCDSHNINGNLTWSGQNFEEIYNNFIPNQYNTQASYARRARGGQQRNEDRGAQFNNARRQDTSWSFWDYLLLQCCIDSLLSGRSNTTVNNVTNINGSSNHQNSEDKRKEAEDGRKLLALGIAAAVAVIIFHVSMCYWYNSSRKKARKEVKIDYLDNKLKTFRNIEFASCAVSLIALIACAVCPVLPAWSLIILGVHSLACFAGGLAFHMKHEEELENIDKAKEAVQGYTNQNLGSNYQTCHDEAPPPYSPHASAPPAYDDQGGYNPFSQMSYADAAEQQPRSFSKD